MAIQHVLLVQALSPCVLHLLLHLHKYQGVEDDDGEEWEDLEREEDAVENVAEDTICGGYYQLTGTVGRVEHGVHPAGIYQDLLDGNQAK